MNSRHTLLLSLCLVAGSGFLAPQALAQQNMVIKLDYGAGSTCDFNTDAAGITVSGSSANKINASGQFDAASNCPTGGGDTGTANVNLSATPASIDSGQSSNIVWSAIADVCRFDGSVLPGAVAGWQTSGFACIGASACQTGGNINPVFNTGGTYNFKLTCYSGAHDSQPQTSDVANAAVTVGGTPPPDDNCVAPQGLTRDLTGKIAYSSGYDQETVDVTQWQSVYGHRIGLPDVGWPGYFNRDVKVTIPRNHYWSLKFTVGNNFPYYGNWGGTVGPYGTWESNATNVTYGVKWTLSITPQCGDFAQPANPDPRNKCFAEYTITTANALLWDVGAGTSNPLSYGCTLRRGQTYYLNILPAPLGDPLNNTGQGCNQATCQGNFAHKGNFDGTQGM